MYDNRLIKLVLYLYLFVVLSSCSIYNKKTYLERFQCFVSELEAVKSFSNDELTSAKKEYLDFTETYYDKYEAELSSEDKRLIVELKARYYAVLAKHKLKGVEESLNEFGEQASEFIEEIMK